MEHIALKKQLFWYAIFHGGAGVVGAAGVVASGSLDGMILFPLFSLTMVIGTLINRTRVQQSKDVMIWLYAVYFWTNLVMTLLLVFQGFLSGSFWSIFRIVWTWKLLGWLKDYKRQLVQRDIPATEIRLSLEYGMDAVYQVENGVCTDILPAELAEDPIVVEQIEELTKAYHQCFINDRHEFSYAPEQFPEAVARVRELYPLVYEKVRALEGKGYQVTIHLTDLIDK